MRVKQASKHELAEAVRGRYLRADRRGKAAILDEFVASTGYHRKAAIRRRRQGPPPQRRGHGGRPRRYSSVVVGALRVAAEASGWPCGKRLAPFLEELVPALEAERALALSDDDRAALVAMSPATVDRRLAPYRRQLRPRGRGTTKPGTLLKHQVPVRTYTPWEDERPGCLEIDLVAHCGTTTAGHYLNTLVATDVATGWTECEAIWGKGQAAVVEAPEQIRGRLPFPLLGLDSDNGSEFLNALLLRWCTAQRLTFTRSRPYWKNDQAHVEQKNWSVVRRLLGYDRYESREALAALQAVYAPLRLWTNHWQPALKLIGKERDGARVRKRYDTARTPYRRALAIADLDPAARQRLDAEHTASGPVALRRRLDAAILALDRHHARPVAPLAEVAG
ncbi:MAG TPA: transposase family protein [Mycobacteriales bacterium]|nr:transposase family protein [Mycobacteriales bacterium]